MLKAFQIKLFCWYNQIIWSGKCPKQQTTMFSPSYDSLTFKSTKNLDIYNTRTLTQVILRHCGHKNQCVLLNNHACTNQFDLINLQKKQLKLNKSLNPKHKMKWWGMIFCDYSKEHSTISMCHTVEQLFLQFSINQSYSDIFQDQLFYWNKLYCSIVWTINLILKWYHKLLL